LSSDYNHAPLTEAADSGDELLFIAPPWPLFNRPSIQIGALKSFLRQRFLDLRITCFHPYLDLASTLGYSAYHHISQSSWAAEAVFAQLLFDSDDLDGRKKSSLRRERLFTSSLKARAVKKTPDFFDICSMAKVSTDRFLASLDLSVSGLIGLTACLNQLTGALYLAKRIRQMMPDLPIVIGGSSVSGGSGYWLLDSFPFLDFVIDGEGELPMAALLEFLAGIRHELPEQVISRRSGQPEKRGESKKLQVPDLNHLPPPDYQDYFKELKNLSSPPTLSVVLPVEASRGCWWGKCTFCNLNIQWSGYRSKKWQRTVKEIAYLSRRYQVLDFAFMDNSLPPKDAVRIFRGLAELGLDLRFFCELRAVHHRDDYREFARGGLQDLQVGIEALSTSLLSRLNKGVTAIENLAALRHAAEHGIEIGANLITRFPGTTSAEVQETRQNLRYAWPFAPLRPVEFWLGRLCPVFQEPDRFGIRAIYPHRNYGALFPSDLLNNINSMIFQYQGDRNRQKGLWHELEKEIREMAEKRSGFRAASLLTYRDGGEFMVIEQVLPDGKTLKHRLSGISREIYIKGMDLVTEDALLSKFSELTRERMDRFLQDLMAKGLLFREGGKILSLATMDYRCYPDC